MTQLIPLQKTIINNESIKTVSARDLHEFLEVKSRFNDWIKNRIEEYNFQAEVDYILFTKILVNGMEKKEYFITLDMAKELSMVERNEKGKEARKYFIACEKELKEVKKPKRIVVKDKEGMPELRKAKAFSLGVNALSQALHLLPNLCDESKQVMVSYLSKEVLGVSILPLPVLEDKTYSATEVGKILGISHNMVGKIANKHGLKHSLNGRYVLDKSRHSNKQVETFRYNDRGVSEISLLVNQN